MPKLKTSNATIWVEKYEKSEEKIEKKIRGKKLKKYMRQKKLNEEKILEKIEMRKKIWEKKLRKKCATSHGQASQFF